MFELLKSTSYIPANIKGDMDRVMMILNDRNVLYRKTRYLVEFVFMNTRWTRNLYLALERIRSRIKNNYRIEEDVTGHLMVSFERFKGFLG